ncbi:MAG: hypothetical protein Q9191_004410 [Dirinaria sp. TL-2023a]
MAKKDAQHGPEKDWEMKVSYVEIYNEQLRDLLLPDTIPPTERAPVIIREDTKGRILLTGLHQVSINSIEDLLNALNFGSSIRQTDATAINAKSSRSHAVFSINLVQRRKAQPSTKQEKRFSVPLEAMSGLENAVTLDSKLHFVDLAGSERLKNTGASGDRAREGIAINAGLASLGKVISQLSSRQPGAHVSYRDSKLTRLLQDALGGNAITYMIACVTPAEFHLSETLNTVQYAKRARAIQIKPEIQQISDESDKQAVIDRLRAEVQFLRDQISSTNHGDMRNDAAQERLERQNDREIELQNHLLDVQENYTALSQRHAKLISEIAKARDDKANSTPTLTEVIGDSAVERLKRSNSFAEAVEQVVLEYEKTIQSLESSLSKTRSSLASTESSLLERESKCAYVDTLNQQLQNKIQKIIDREANTETYLRDLEARLDGQATGEEKSSAVVIELRKEISRIRENEASCEEYISTLEERLAESDQDMELMRREVDRLENVVERQRSIGKLDNLLYEFDHVQQNGKFQHQSKASKTAANRISQQQLNSQEPKYDLQDAVRTVIPESDDEDLEDGDPLTPRYRALDVRQTDVDDEKIKAQEINGFNSEHGVATEARPSTAQSRLRSEKLDNVTQELFALRSEHETTITEYNLMSAKYEEALRTLAELQDAADEARHPAPPLFAPSPASTRPTSFLGDARVNELRHVGQLPSSRSLSSELSLAAESNTSVEHSMDGSPLTSKPSGTIDEMSQAEILLRQENEHLKKAQDEKDAALIAIKDQYTELQDLHAETLDFMEELKTEVERSKRSPTSPANPLVRRKGSQNMLTLDRAHRALASLKNIAAENLEDKPDTMQNFELNLNMTMQELYEKAERVQVLDVELTKVKKEMEAKSTMISGLARERSSLQSSPVDISVMSSIQQQLMQNENQVKALQETHAAREQELLSQVESLKQLLDEQAQQNKPAMPGFFPETPATLDNAQLDTKQLGQASTAIEVTRLQEEVREWQNKHDAVINSMQASEKELLSTISELETAMASVDTLRSKNSEIEGAARFAVERTQLSQALESLNKELQEHKKVIATNREQIADLERSQVAAREQLQENARYRAFAEAQINSHSDQMKRLEQTILEHKSDVEFHKHGLRSLHDSHAKEVENVRFRLESDHAHDRATQHAELKLEHEQQYERQKAEFEEAMQETNSQLTEAVQQRDQLQQEQRALVDEFQSINRKLLGVEDTIQTKVKELDSVKKRNRELTSALTEATSALEEFKRSADEKSAELNKVIAEKKKADRLVDELEDQLSATYDQHRAASSRLSVLSQTHDQALQEVTSAKAKLEEELEMYRNKLNQAEVEKLPRQHSFDALTSDQLDRSSLQPSSLRKSNSAISLPSPPPTIPLPQIPTIASATTSPQLPNGGQSPSPDTVLSHQHFEAQEDRIRSIERHLFAEKQLTNTLEEALVDLESQGNKVKMDMEVWKKKAWGYEEELIQLKRERGRMRDSVQAVEEERIARKEAERARERLEERMRGMESKKKKKGGFNCF